MTATEHSPVDRVVVARAGSWDRFIHRVTPFLFLVPAVVLVSVLLIWPFIRSAYWSFTDYAGIGAANWIGIENYRTFVNDPAITTSVKNTLLWVLGTMIFPVGLGLLIASLSFEQRGGSLLRLPFLLPYALSGTAIATVWQFLLNKNGAINGVLEAIGLESWTRSWLYDPPWNTWAMIIASTWQAVGVAVLLFLIGLQVIPKDPVEAARLDGAQGLRLFIDMTLPMLRPMMIVVVGISLVNSLKTFDIIWIMTQGGPYRSSETLAVTMYRETFLLKHFGYGSAISVVLSIVVIAVSMLYLKRTLKAT
jgi:multiple sugar transport system permease protein